MDISLLSCEGEHADLLAIDDLLDFSNDDIGGPIDSSENSTPSCELPTLSSHVSSPKDKKSSNHAPCVFDSNELCVPCDDLAELEWLSNFVEESFSSGDHVPASFCFGSTGKFTTDESITHRDFRKDSYQSTSPVSVLKSSTHSRDKSLSFKVGPDMSVPARARSKRCRTAVCFWNTQILSAEASESLLESSSTTSTITSDSEMITTYYDHDDDDYDDKNDNEDDDEEEEIDDEIHGDRLRHYYQHKRVGDPSVKVKKFNKVLDSFSNSKPKKLKVQDGGQAVRKCLHCATQKTPQWRAGPMGPKTLCNACGVRYKSGRLCAEYRPAASPTFVEELHSNSHRKVLEMRRKRGEFMSPSGIRH